ncbi:MAG: cobalamin-dependent protein [Nitrospirales bacterium]
MRKVSELEKALLSLDRFAVKKIITNLDDESTPIERVEKLIEPTLERIGKEWEMGNIALSQVYMSGRMCEELLDTILPPGDSNRKNQPRIAIAALHDFHLLGCCIVRSVLRASGFEVIYYGQKEVDGLVSCVENDKIEMLLVSTLMLPSALQVKELREKLNRSGLSVKVVVGGAPFRFDEKLWREVGADAMGRDAGEAVKIISRMVKEVS